MYIRIYIYIYICIHTYVHIYLYIYIYIYIQVLFVLVLLGLFYIKVATKMADSIWEIQIEDLHFDTPAEILGRGTFGLVVAAK